jgi:uncharacterized protein YpmS
MVVEKSREVKLPTRLRTAAFTLACLLTVLACGLSAPQPPVPSLVASTADAGAFEQAVGAAATQAASTGNFSLSVTQEQLSSWLQLKAPQYARSAGHDWPFKDIQAGLSNNKITIYGVIDQQGVPQTPAQIVFTPSVAADGSLAISIDSGQVGVVGLPADTLKSVTATIKDTLNQQLARIKNNYHIATLTIADGQLTIAGSITR